MCCEAAAAALWQRGVSCACVAFAAGTTCCYARIGSSHHLFAGDVCFCALRCMLVSSASTVLTNARRRLVFGCLCSCADLLLCWQRQSDAGCDAYIYICAPGCRQADLSPTSLCWRWWCSWASWRHCHPKHPTLSPSHARLRLRVCPALFDHHAVNQTSHCSYALVVQEEQGRFCSVCCSHKLCTQLCMCAGNQCGDRAQAYPRGSAACGPLCGQHTGECMSLCGCRSSSGGRWALLLQDTRQPGSSHTCVGGWRRWWWSRTVPLKSTTVYSVFTGGGSGNPDV